MEFITPCFHKLVGDGKLNWLVKNWKYGTWSPTLSPNNQKREGIWEIILEQFYGL